MGFEPEQDEKEATSAGFTGPLVVGLLGVAVLFAEYLELDVARGTTLALRTGWALLLGAAIWMFFIRLRRTR